MTLKIKTSPIEKAIRIKNIPCEICLNRATLSVLFIQDTIEKRKKKKDIFRRFMCSKDCVDVFKAKYS